MGNRPLERGLSRREFIGGVAGLGLLAACRPAGTPQPQSSQPAGGQPKRGGTLYWYLPDDPPDLDPHMQTTSSLQWICGLVYNGLLKYDIRPGNPPGSPGANTPVPDLAESWEQTDPLTYVFRLRRGVRFHDGTELTAEDAAFSLNRIRTRDPQFQRAYAFEPVETAEALDRYTLRVRMREPYAAFINQVSAAYTRVAPKHVIEQQGDLKQTMVGTGPYRLKEYRRGVRFVFERNPDYFGAPLPYVETIEIRIIPDASAQLAAFTAGQLDIYTPANVDEFENLRRTIPGLQSLVFSRAEMNGIGLNLRRRPFDDIRVRQALWYAIDQDEVIKVVWRGQGYKHRAVPPALGDWAVPYEQLPLSDSPNYEKARQLLREAGYPDGFEFECKTVYRYTQKEAQVVAEQLKRIGVRMNIVDMEYGAFLNARNRGDFEAIAFALSPFGDVEDFTYALFHTRASRNFGGWGSPDLDRMFEEARREMDVQKRKALYARIQRELATQCYVLDLPRSNGFEVWRPYVKDWVPAENPERGLAFHYVWLDK